MDMPSLPADKANHFVYGAAIACVVAVLFNALLALGVVAFFAIGKEASDWWQNRKGGTHGVEYLDALATIAGGVAVVLPKFLSIGIL